MSKPDPFFSALLESGTDIRPVQELMGPDRLETTQIYLHCRRKPGLGVKSPFDQLGQRPPPPPEAKYSIRLQIPPRAFVV